MAEPDELFTLRSYFFLGDYARALEEAENVVADTNELQVLRDVYAHRSRIMLGRADEVRRSIGSNAPVQLQVVKLLAIEGNSPVLDKLDEWAAESAYQNDITFRVLAGLVYERAGNFKAALNLVRRAEALEEMAISAQIFLKMNRSDLAKGIVQKMQERDEDDTLTQFTLASLHLASGKERVEEAGFILNEMQQRFHETVKVVEMLAVVRMCENRFGEALKLLKKADTLQQETGAPSGTANTLVNTFVSLMHAPQLGKASEISQRVTSSLQTNFPSDPFFQHQAELNSLFTRAAAKYS